MGASKKPKITYTEDQLKQFIAICAANDTSTPGKRQQVSDAFQAIITHYDKAINITCQRTARYEWRNKSDDIIQIAHLELFRAIPRYDPTRGSFATYIRVIIRGKLATDFKLSQSKKKKHNLPLVSFDYSFLKDNPDDVVDGYGNTEQTTETDPADICAEKQSATILIKQLMPKLSEFERFVLFMRFRKATYAAIDVEARSHGYKQIGVKAIDNALSRIKLKARRIKGMTELITNKLF